MNELRTVTTPQGTITYTLVKKRVKNLNLRVGAGGEVTMSAPMGCPAARADELVAGKSRWIIQACSRQSQRQAPLLPPLPRPLCQLQLEQAVERAYPLVAELGVARPLVKIRLMRGSWGNCHWKQGYITLNTALCRCPQELQDYVALHELVHFLHHDHGAGFYGRMDALMPQWRQRRQQLKAYGAALSDRGDQG